MGSILVLEYEPDGYDKYDGIVVVSELRCSICSDSDFS
jgi:hypothetical protein